MFLKNLDSNNKEIISSFKESIKELMEKKRIPGVSIAIVKKDRIIWNESFGYKSMDTKEPVSNDTIFEGASLSKPLFAYGVLNLVEKKILNLDTPIKTIFPKKYVSDPRIDLITPRMVLSHTTGFPNWCLENHPLEIYNYPGEKFGYSGEGYVYLQKAIEYFLSTPLNEYMLNTVLHPLGMKKSSYIWIEDYEALSAVGHTIRNKTVPKNKPSESLSAATLHTTAHEFALFVIDVFKLKHYQSSILNTTELMEEVLKPQISLNSELSWGLGWGLQETKYGRSFWHWGDNTVFKSIVIGFLNEELGFVITTNSKKGIKFLRSLFNQILDFDLPCFKFLANLEPYMAYKRKSKQK